MYVVSVSHAVPNRRWEYEQVPTSILSFPGPHTSNTRVRSRLSYDYTALRFHTNVPSNEHDNSVVLDDSNSNGSNAKHLAL